jgi:hypothetical protein
MLERFDLEFKAILERQLLLKLRGDDGQGGLYRGILSCEDMNAFNRTRGEIQAYEHMLELMTEVAKRMNENEQPMHYASGVRARRFPG